MFFKHAQIYRLPAKWAFTTAQMIAALAPHTFTPAGKNEAMRQGWAPPREHGELVHSVGGQWLLQLKTEKKLLPATVINQVAKERAAEMEEAQGFAPGRKAMKELKERVAAELLPQAFNIKSATNIWIDPVHGWLVVDAASPAKADEAIKMLLKAVDRMPLESLRVNRSPVGVMTEWLQADDAPAGFTVDMDALLRATGESKAQVAYKKHTLEADEVRRHIAAGKQCTRLAMTWESKISFVLDETLSIKSIKPLDVLKETENSTRNDDERFDGDFMLMAGELNKLLTDLVEALGGQADGSLPAAEPVPRDAALAPAGQRKLERAVGLTAELYKARSRHREVLNELYDETIQPVIEHVREQMTKTGDGAIESAIALAKAQPAGSTASQLFLVAAVEIIEPSPPRANGQGLGAVPPGDGSAADPLYAQTVEIVRTNRRASISLVQRLLRVGYNRAARLLEAMEGSVVGPMLSNGNREVLNANA